MGVPLHEAQILTYRKLAKIKTGTTLQCPDSKRLNKKMCDIHNHYIFNQSIMESNHEGHEAHEGKTRRWW